MNNIILQSSQVYLAENQENPNSHFAKFVICDFGRNKNGVALNKDTIDSWLSTLLNQPLVGKISMKTDGSYDFTGHNLNLVKKTDDDGNEYEVVEFDTSAFGSFVEVAVETVDDKEYIVATAEIWKRFTKACEVILNRIKSSTLHTSWEIYVDDSTPTLVDGMVTKVINAGRFIGHCLLGEDVEPAYDSSGLLQIASNEYGSDIEIAESLVLDILEDSKKENKAKEDSMAKSKLEKVKNAEATLETSGEVEEVQELETETVVEDVDANDTEDTDEVETSQLTVFDIISKIESLVERGWVSHLFPEERECLVRYWELDDLQYFKYSYEVDGDNVTISEPETVKLVYSVKDINAKVAEFEKLISEKDELIVKSGAELQALKSENAELSQYKEKFNKAEQERIAAELEAQKEELILLVTSSNLLTREEIELSDELSGYVNELDQKSLMSVVGLRLAESLKDTKAEPEVASTSKENPVVNLNNDDSGDDRLSIVKNYLNR